MRLSYFHLAAIIGLVILPACMVDAEQIGGNVGASNASAYALDRRAGPPDHIVVVVEENHGYSQIIGNPDAAYINSLAAVGTLFTNYHAVSHPSEPNYFALFAGSTQGIRDDGTYFWEYARPSG
jgi:phosphatidylinositol-3-phosphatase